MSHDGSQDDERDNIAFVMERVAKLWAEKLDDETLAIHGRRVYQVFKDYGFRTTEALVAENAKIQNMEHLIEYKVARHHCDILVVSFDWLSEFQLPPYQ